jgi:SAM-dependent methyltransferase
VNSTSTLNQVRRCPLCGAAAGRSAFPFATEFNNKRFHYLACSGCSCVYVDPVPDAQTFERMYAKSQYHDAYYGEVDDQPYVESAGMLAQVLPANARVLDYGCGTGAFLRALQSAGFVPFGVEFDRDAAQAASLNARCEVLTVEDFWARDVGAFDAIHLGDVLEHLPEPAIVLRQLLGRLRAGGILFAEGPLEVNPSPVYWSASLFGWAKRAARPGFTATHPPTHLFRASARQQLAFFQKLDSGLSLRKWQVYETGWPYTHGGKLKRGIARLAVALASGSRHFGVFGNRFRGVFVHEPEARAAQAPPSPARTPSAT